MGDLHDSKYDSLGVTYHVSAFDQTLNYTKADGSHHCVYDIEVYPSDELRHSYETYMPYLFARVVMMISVQ